MGRQPVARRRSPAGSPAAGPPRVVASELEARRPAAPETPAGSPPRAPRDPWSAPAAMSAAEHLAAAEPVRGLRRPAECRQLAARARELPRLAARAQEPQRPAARAQEPQRPAVGAQGLPAQPEHRSPGGQQVLPAAPLARSQFIRGLDRASPLPHVQHCRSTPHVLTDQILIHLTALVVTDSMEPVEYYVALYSGIKGLIVA